MPKIYFSYSGEKQKIAMPEGLKKERIKRKSTFIDTNRVSDLPKVPIAPLLEAFGFESKSSNKSNSKSKQKHKKGE